MQDNVDHKKTQEELEIELIEAEKMIKIGSRYSHFKRPDRTYKVVGLGIQERTEKICVIYQAEYGRKLIFVRDLESWLEQPQVGVDRFKLVE